MENKELKMKFDNFTRGKISKASLPVNYFGNQPKKILPFMRLFWGEEQKYLQSQNNATYNPMNPDTDVYIYLTNVLSTSFLMFRITFDEISTKLSIQIWLR